MDEAILLAEKFNETEGFGSKYQLFKTSCEQIYEKLLSADKITFSPECVEDPSGNKKFSKRLEIIKEFFGTNCNMDLVTYTAFIDEVTVQPKLDSIVDKCSYLIDTVVLSPTQRYDNYCRLTINPK